VGDDFEANSSLDMRELRTALGASMMGLGIEKLAVLGFDACLMSMLEIAYELKDLTMFIVGSQQTERAEGWPYDKVLGAMKDAPEPEPLAATIVQVYIKFYEEHGFVNGTQSAVDTSKVEAAMQALHEFGKALSEQLQEDGDTFRQKIKRARM